MTTLSRDKTFAEFFAGIGLVRDALAARDWSCVYANDIDPKKQQIYEARFGGGSEFHLADIRLTDEVLSRIPSPPFLATASFPCIDLSLAGHWRGLGGEHSSTFFGFADVLGSLASPPQLLLLENVPGLLTSNAGRDFATLAVRLSELGYWVDAFTLDAKCFVPQSRQRVFVVGVHQTAAEAVRERFQPRRLFRTADDLPNHGSSVRPERLLKLMDSTYLPTGWMGLDIPVPRESRMPLNSILDQDDRQEWWDAAAVEKHYHMMSDRHQTLVDRLKEDDAIHVGTIFRRKRHGSTRAEVRFDGLAGCLRTPRGGSARQIVIVSGRGSLRMRWMSPIECARLQGAGHYPILDNVNQMLFGFGDAVCVPVVRWIDAHVLTPAYDAITHSRQEALPVAG